MAAKLRRARGSNGYLAMMHWCPGCNEVHGYRIAGGDGGPCWTFSGDMDAPSFSPSMLIFVTHTEDENENPLPQPRRETLCHYFVKRGSEIPAARQPGLDPNKSYIDFCGDSPHALKGKIVDLPDWPYAPGTYGGIED